ncbi:hypothetical protein C8F04DRAFT_1340834 [Mycena alexandri]|uniref:Uncharacterized protein n=1 Tax=Mycena alexandri TaxID=1745969 RepID=A0AAD6T0W0_9AGAR|nr:hypothetical protein C8F04DRAFT_1340834 [Mycena alexandri]
MGRASPRSAGPAALTTSRFWVRVRADPRRRPAAPRRHEHLTGREAREERIFVQPPSPRASTSARRLHVCARSDGRVPPSRRCAQSSPASSGINSSKSRSASTAVGTSENNRIQFTSSAYASSASSSLRVVLRPFSPHAMHDRQDECGAPPPPSSLVLPSSTRGTNTSASASSARALLSTAQAPRAREATLHASAQLTATAARPIPHPPPHEHEHGLLFRCPPRRPTRAPPHLIGCYKESPPRQNDAHAPQLGARGSRGVHYQHAPAARIYQRKKKKKTADHLLHYVRTSTACGATECVARTHATNSAGADDLVSLQAVLHHPTPNAQHIGARRPAQRRQKPGAGAHAHHCNVVRPGNGNVDGRDARRAARPADLVSGYVSIRIAIRVPNQNKNKLSHRRLQGHASQKKRLAHPHPHRVPAPAPAHRRPEETTEDGGRRMQDAYTLALTPLTRIMRRDRHAHAGNCKTQNADADADHGSATHAAVKGRDEKQGGAVRYGARVRAPCSTLGQTPREDTIHGASTHSKS